MTRILLVVLLVASAAQADIVVRGGVSGTPADVDSNNNVKVTLPVITSQSGFARLVDKDGINPLWITASGRASVALDSMSFYDAVDGSAVNGGLWTAPVTTFTIAQATGFITLNSSAVTTANAAARLSSVGQFEFFGRQSLLVAFRAKSVNLPASNATAELGFGSASGTTAPTDGAFFRWTSGGEFRAVVNFNGAETSSALTAPADSTTHDLAILVYHDSVRFFVDNVQVVKIDIPAGNPNATAASHQPVLVRLYNGASPPASAPQIAIAQATVLQIGGQNTPWPVQAGSLQRSISVHPQTFAAQARVDHSTTAQTMTSNTAPAANNTGGDFIFATIAGGTSEYPMFAYQVPTSYRAVVTGVRINVCAYGAATATTPQVFQWYLGTGATAASLATADNGDFTTFAPRRIPIGTQAIAVAAPVGACANEIESSFTTPIVVESARYLHVILAMPIGTATASEVYRGTVMLNGYFE